MARPDRATELGVELLYKTGLSMAIVIGLSLVAERVRPRVAGILAGFPLGLALSLFFYGHEQGADFVGRAAPFALLGLVCIQCFIGGYYLGSLRPADAAAPQARLRGLLTASLAALAAFFAGSALLRPLELPVPAALAVAIASVLGFHWLFRHIPDAASIDRRVRFGPGVLLFRAALAAAVIVLVTSVAHLIGSSWAGLFAAFPYTLYPLLLIVHYSYGPRHVHSIVRVYPQGLSACLVYVPAVALCYPRFGVYWGTALSLAAAALWLALWSALLRRRAARTAAG